MNDARSALFSTCFHDLFRQVGFVVRADGKTFAEEPTSSADGPTQKSLPSHFDAPPHHLLVVRGFSKWPGIGRSLTIQFP